MKLHDLHPPAGATRPKRRVARGTGGKGGKTAGRGTKGQGQLAALEPHGDRVARALAQRIPKLKGFKNPFRVAYAVVNLDTLGQLEGTEVTPDTLVASGLVRKGAMVKVLGRGEARSGLRVAVHAVSASARAAIEGAGGTIEILPPPFGNGRPPARGNALTNR